MMVGNLATPQCVDCQTVDSAATVLLVLADCQLRQGAHGFIR
jgi:hypothetical protein